MTTRLPGLVTGDLEGDIAIGVLVLALLLMLRVLDLRLPATGRFGALAIEIGLLSVAAALFIDTQRATSLPYLNAPVDIARAGAGHSIYEQHCMGCHGETGRGDGHTVMVPRNPALNLTVHIFQHDEAYLAQVIRNGRGAMPGFRSKLIDAQIGDVIQYVRQLGQKRP